MEIDKSYRERRVQLNKPAQCKGNRNFTAKLPYHAHVGSWDSLCCWVRVRVAYINSKIQKKVAYIATLECVL